MAMLITNRYKFSMLGRGLSKSCQCLIPGQDDSPGTTSGCCSLWIKSDSSGVFYDGIATGSPGENIRVCLTCFIYKFPEIELLIYLVLVRGSK